MIAMHPSSVLSGRWSHWFCNNGGTLHLYSCCAPERARQEGTGMGGVPGIRVGREHKRTGPGWEVCRDPADLWPRMRAQGYDRVANMARGHRGVQAIIRQRVPDAVNVHCKAHTPKRATGLEWIVWACKGVGSKLWYRAQRAERVCSPA